MKDYFFVVNPVSGSHKGVEIYESIKYQFEKRGIICHARITDYENHAYELTNTFNIKSFDAIIAIGGDGTMHEVINGMMDRGDKKTLPIGLIPGGTGNSYMHDQDCLDPLMAAEIILNNNITTIDLGLVRQKIKDFYAFNVLGWGLPVSINLLAEKMRWLGGQRYNVASILEIFRKPTWQVKMIIDDEVIEGKYCFVLACNTKHSGNGMKVAPHAKLNDGKTDLLIVKSPSRFELIKLFGKIFSGEHIHEKAIEYRQVSSFELISKAESILNVDGQNMGMTPFKLEILKDKLEVFI